MNYIERGYKPVTIILPNQYIRTIRLGTIFTLGRSTNTDYPFIDYLLDTYLPIVDAIPKIIDMSPYCLKIKKKIIIKEEHIDTIHKRFGTRSLNRTILYFLQLYLRDNPDLEQRYERAVR